MSDSERERAATDSLTCETLLKLLASERRRHVLSSLAENDPLALPDLADEVAAREHDVPLPQVPEDDVLQVYLSLWHVHIPQLVDADVVSYDQDQDIVSLAENAHAVEEFVSPETPPVED